MFSNFKYVPDREIAPGFLSKLIHTQNNTINFLSIHQGSQLPLHSHPHEQTTIVLEGVFEMTVNGETKQMGPEDFVVIPGGISHGGKAIVHCKMVDVFSPVREDYR